MFDRNKPTGSPLSPASFPEASILDIQGTRSPSGPFGGLPSVPLEGRPIVDQSAPFGNMPSTYDLPTSGVPSLPKPPRSKRSNIWDREHISETLADIGAGFFAGQNFSDGLGAASRTIANRTRQLREEGRPDISYGGPNDQFEISTDRRTGAKTIREVPEFKAAADRDRVLKDRPDFKTQADMRSRALFTIATQLPPEQRAEAYRDLIANPEFYGVDPTGMPAEWDDRYGTVTGTMGLSVNEGLNQKRNDAKLADDMRHNRVMEDLGGQRVQQGNVRAQAAATHAQQGGANLRTPPASVRKPRSGTLSPGTSMSGFVFQGGDPANRNNWKKQ